MDTVPVTETERVLPKVSVNSIFVFCQSVSEKENVHSESECTEPLHVFTIAMKVSNPKEGKFTAPDITNIKFS